MSTRCRINGDVADPNLLFPHPLSQKIYGKPGGLGDYKDLSESIYTKGILEPLVITKDGTIISGCRRWHVACSLSLTKVPVVLFKSENLLDIEEAVIHANRQRVKTPEMIAREGKELKRIETAKAKARKKSGKSADGVAGGRGKKKNHSKPVSEGLSDGKASDLAAAQLGISGPTLDAGIAVVDAIDKAEEAGDAAKADDLRQTLNTKGVKPAKRKADGEPQPMEQKGQHKEKNKPRPRQGMRLARRAIIDLEKIAENDLELGDGFQCMRDWLRKQPKYSPSPPDPETPDEVLPEAEGHQGKPFKLNYRQSDCMKFARAAVWNLKQLKRNDLRRPEAFKWVREWMVRNE